PDERRIDGEVDRVAERGEADLAAEQVRIAVGVEVAGEVEKLADHQKRPGEPRLRLVQPHGDADCDGRGEPDDVDHYRIALERRHGEVTDREKAHRGDVPEPQIAAGGAEECCDVHAATPASAVGRASGVTAAGWKSKAFASLPRTSFN